MESCGKACITTPPGSIGHSTWAFCANQCGCCQGALQSVTGMHGSVGRAQNYLTRFVRRSTPCHRLGYRHCTVLPAFFTPKSVLLLLLFPSLPDCRFHSWTCGMRP